MVIPRKGLFDFVLIFKSKMELSLRSEKIAEIKI